MKTICAFIASILACVLSASAEIPEKAIPFILDSHVYIQGVVADTIPVSLIYDTGADRLYMDKDYMDLSTFGKLPYKTTQDKSILYIVNQNISISKQDWDAHETSWDFKENELVRIFNDNGWGTLDIVVSEYKREWERLFMQLHANEEELNRQFIDIYGLQDELTPDVPLDEITILQQGEVSFNL